MTTCSAYGAIVPFKSIFLSISRSGGVSAQGQDGAGHVGIVGYAGDADVDVEEEEDPDDLTRSASRAAIRLPGVDVDAAA